MNNLKLESLGRKVIKEILHHLSGKEKVDILVCCRGWNKVVMPILWEDITPRCNQHYNTGMYNGFRKYGHYIKYLDLGDHLNVPIDLPNYQHSKKLCSSLNDYLKHREYFEHMMLVGLYYSTQIDSIPTEEYIPIYKICVKEILQNLRHLQVSDLSDYFITSIVPYLPSSITSLIISENSIYNPISCLEQVLNKFDNLKVLKLTSVYMDLKDYNYLMNRQFPHLRDFCFNFVSVRGLKETIIDLNNYPKLESFTIFDYSKLKFNGVSNLKELTLIGCNLMNQAINNRIFPKLNQLSLETWYTVSSQFLHSIFTISAITYLNLSICNLSFLIKEIYPKKNNNIITLSVRKSTLGIDFLNFLYTSCPTLCNLEVVDCDFDTNIPFPNNKTINDSYLTNVIFRNKQSSKNSIYFIDYILAHFKRINSIAIPRREKYVLAKYIGYPQIIFCDTMPESY